MSAGARFRVIVNPVASSTVLLNTLQLVETTMFLSTGGTAAIVCASDRAAVACACLGPTVAASTHPPASSASARQPAPPRPVTRRRTLMVLLAVAADPVSHACSAARSSAAGSGRRVAASAAATAGSTVTASASAIARGRSSTVMVGGVGSWPPR